MIQWNKIDDHVLIKALDDIPFVRDGKGDIDALMSFHSDVRTHREFMRAYNLADWKSEKIDLINKWNNFIQLRNQEDFITHFDSKNKLLYKSLFNL
jgi:hypothetical protein